MKNMRQVIKTNQNFVTGEHYEQRVLKPIQAAHNRVTVQLCDAASGKLVEEAVTENAISSILESDAYGAIAASINNGEMLNYTQAIRPSAIVLSSSDAPELADPYFIHGSVTGFCNRADTSGSGSNALKGIYNSTESYSEYTDAGLRHIHLVYDWLTSSGNGKIQTISWITNSINDPSRRPLACASLLGENPATQNVFDNVRFDRHGNTYIITNSKYYKVLNQLRFLNKIESAKLAASESFYKPYEVNGYYYSASCEYANSGKPTYTQVMRIKKYDYDGNVVDTWTEDLITSIPQLVELRNSSKLGEYNGNKPDCYFRNYCDYDGWIGAYVQYINPNAQNVFPQRNSAGELEQNKTRMSAVYTFYNVLTKQWLHTPSPWDVWTSYEQYTNATVLKKLTDAHYIMQSSSTENAYKSKISSSGISTENYWNNLVSLSSPGYGYPTSQFHATYPIYIGSSPTSFSPFTLRPIVAQTRLAAPITKTSLNTMKIQYDFFFKIPLPYMTPDHVWDLYK